MCEILARGQAHGNKTETQASVAKLPEHRGCLLLNSKSSGSNRCLVRTNLAASSVAKVTGSLHPDRKLKASGTVCAEGRRVRFPRREWLVREKLYLGPVFSVYNVEGE